MLYLKQVCLEAFRSFAGKNKSPLLPRSGLCLVKGRNVDTGGSSGSGKSTIGLAIQHAFGNCPFPATTLQSNCTDRPLQVELSLETDEGEAIIKRGKETSVSSKGKTITSAKAVTEKINQITGLSPDLFRALTYREQKAPGLFLTLTDSEKKSFLSQLLGLEELEDNIDKSNQKGKDLEIEALKIKSTQVALELNMVVPTKPIYKTEELLRDILLDLNKELAVATSLEADFKKEYDNLVSTRNTDRMPIKTRLDAERVALTNQHLAVKNARAMPDVSVKSPEEIELEGFYKQCDSHIKNRKELLNSGVLERQGKLNELNTQKLSLTRIVSQKDQIANKINELTNQIQIAQSNKCPTCEQTWNKSQNKVENWNLELAKYNSKLSECATAADQIGKLDLEKATVTVELQQFKTQAEGELNDLVETLKNISNALSTEIQKRNSVYTVWMSQTASEDAQMATELAVLDKNHQNVLREFDIKAQSEKEEKYKKVIEYSQKLLEIKGKIFKTQAEIDGVLAYNELSTENYNKAVTKYEGTLKQVQDHADHLARVETEMNAELDLAQALKTFLGAIFEEVLQEISHESNELLKCIPNVATTTIQFTSDRTTQKGTTKQEIKPVVTKKGVQVPLKAGLSGGQLTSVELAVDLALGRVISRRTGKTPGWLILDECFDGLDVESKEACLAMLKEVAKDRLILIIDHSTEIKESFDLCIEVESQNDISRIVEA